MKPLINSIIFAIMLLIISCGKKDSSFFNPTIQFISPADNATFTVFDSIPVILEVNSEKTVEIISITIINDDKTPLFSSYTSDPMKKNIRLEFYYPIDDPLLESGTYKLRAQVYAGAEVARKAIDIQIMGQPKELENMIVVTQENPKFHTVYEVSNTLETEILLELRTDYSGSGINSAHDILFFAARQYGDMQALSLETGNILWVVEGEQSSQFPYFTNLQVHEDEVVVCFYDGYVRSYNRFGNTVFNSIQLEEAYPVRSFVYENFVIAQTNHYLGQETELRTFFWVSGEQELRNEINRELIAIFPKDNESFFLLSKDHESSYIDAFKLMRNSMINYREFENIQFTSATIMDEDNFLIASDAAIYRYRVDISNSTEFIQRSDIGLIRYEPVNEQIYAASGHELLLFSSDYGHLQNHVTFADSVVNFHFNYNK
ncbi:MAG: hypothetical protein K9I94_02485 [Bacteroidales bacterium]|nr:hypothetical protein [Bacteroidales bacterium]